jgi:hypothetical protein
MFPRSRAVFESSLIYGRAQEIQNLVQASSSPAQPVFEVDLTQQSATESPSPSLKVHEILPEGQMGSSSIPDQCLPPTLETRKKKKKKTDSVSPDKGGSTLQEPNVPDVNGRLVKSGSKRKFSPDEDGALSDGDGVQECDEFQFSRPTQSPPRPTDLLQSMHQDTSPIKTPVSLKRGSATGTMKRKVLEPSKEPTPNLADYTCAFVLTPSTRECKFQLRLPQESSGIFASGQ